MTVSDSSVLMKEHMEGSLDYQLKLMVMTKDELRVHLNKRIRRVLAETTQRVADIKAGIYERNPGMEETMADLGRAHCDEYVHAISSLQRKYASQNIKDFLKQNKLYSEHAFYSLMSNLDNKRKE